MLEKKRARQATSHQVNVILKAKALDEASVSPLVKDFTIEDAILHISTLHTPSLITSFEFLRDRVVKEAKVREMRLSKKSRMIQATIHEFLFETQDSFDPMVEVSYGALVERDQALASLKHA